MSCVALANLPTYHKHTALLNCIDLPQYARDFYIAQWIYDGQVELEKLLKEPSTEDDLEPETTNTALALQQSEDKVATLRSLLDPRKKNRLKVLEGVLDDKKAVIVTKALVACRALSKSFDMYLRDVSVCALQ